MSKVKDLENRHLSTETRLHVEERKQKELQDDLARSEVEKNSL